MTNPVRADHNREDDAYSIVRHVLSPMLVTYPACPTARSRGFSRTLLLDTEPANPKGRFAEP